MIFSQEELRAWVTKSMPTLIGQGRHFNRAVYNETFLALDVSRDDIVTIIPDDAVDAEHLLKQFFDMYESSEHTTVRDRLLFEGIHVLLADSVEPPVPERAGSRKKTNPARPKTKPARSDYRGGKQSQREGSASVLPDPLHVREHARFQQEPDLDDLLRRALSKTTPTEICFVHLPLEENIHVTIGTASERSSIGTIYSLDKTQMRCILQECASMRITSPVISWTLSIVPCSQRDIFSIAVHSARRHTRQDTVIATYVPAKAECTVGMTVVHFFSQEEAMCFWTHVFKGRRAAPAAPPVPAPRGAGCSARTPGPTPARN